MSQMPADPRDVATQRFGTALRDAAVDPADNDFLGPTNAGAEGDLGNPHGPHVVNPQLHGDEDNRSIRPGPVSSDPEQQNADELENLHQWQPQTVAPEPDPDPEN